MEKRQLRHSAMNIKKHKQLLNKVKTTLYITH